MTSVLFKRFWNFTTRMVLCHHKRFTCQKTEIIEKAGNKSCTTNVYMMTERFDRNLISVWKKGSAIKFNEVDIWLQYPFHTFYSPDHYDRFNKADETKFRVSHFVTQHTLLLWKNSFKFCFSFCVTRSWTKNKHCETFAKHIKQANKSWEVVIYFVHLYSESVNGVLFQRQFCILKQFDFTD